MKRIENKRNMWYQLFHISHIPISEIRIIFFQSFSRFFHGCFISSFLSYFIIRQCLNSQFPSFDTFLRRRGDNHFSLCIFHLIPTIDNIINSRYKTVNMASSKERQKSGNFHLE